MEVISTNKKIKTKANIILFSVLLANFIRNLGASIVDIGLPQFVLSLAGSLSSYGLIIGAYSLTQGFCQFPIAYYSDKFGRKKMVMLGMLIYITGTFLCFTAQSIIQLIIYRAIQGAGAYSSIMQAIIADSFNKDKQGKAMSLYSFSLTLGYFGGIVIGGYITYYLNFRAIFLISGSLAVISLILIILLLKDVKKKKNEEIVMLKQDQVTEVTQRGLKFKKIRKLLGQSQYRFAVLLNLVRWFLFGGVVAYLIWVLQIHFGLTSIVTSYFLLMIVAFYVSFVLISGKLIDKFGTKQMLLTGQILIIVFGCFYIIVSFTNNLFIFIVASMFSGIGFAMFQTSANTNLLKTIVQIDPKLKGTGFGFNNTLGFLFSSLGPITLSFIGEISIFLPYYYITSLVIVAFIITLRLIEK